MISIIYTYPADIRLPILEVYNANGEKINQLELYYYRCPLDQDSHSKNNSYQTVSIPTF